MINGMFECHFLANSTFGPNVYGVSVLVGFGVGRNGLHLKCLDGM